MEPISAIAAIALALAAAADAYQESSEESPHRKLVEFLAMQAAMIHQTQRQPPGRYTSIMDYVLDQGKLYRVRQLDSEQLAYVQRVMDRSHWPFRVKECFTNAQYALFYDFDKRLAYVEGYAVGPASFPVHHAWVTVDGIPVELTWRGSEPGPLVQPGPHFAYFGVEYDSDWLKKRLLERQAGVSVIDDYEKGWPELQKPRLRPFPQSSASDS
jgi:hypothetical protein